MEKIEVQTIIRHVRDGGSVVNIENRTDSFNRVEGNDELKFTVNLAAGTITVPIAPMSNVNFVYLKAVYQSDDLPNNILTGDPAPVEVEFNNSGVFVAISEQMSRRAKGLAA